MSYASGNTITTPPRKVRMDAVSDAWELLKAQLGTWVLGYLIIGGVALGVSAILSGITTALFGSITPTAGATPMSILPATLARSLPNNIVSILVNAFFAVGLYRMALKQVRGEAISVGDLFTGGDVLLPMVGATLSIVLLTYITGGLALIPVIMSLTKVTAGGFSPAILGPIYAGVGIFLLVALVIGTFTMLVNPLIADGRAGAWGAIGESFSVIKSDFGNALLFLFVLGLCASLGILGCGVGVIFTAPLLPLGIAVVYRDLFDGERRPGQPTLNVPLPPPSAYGVGSYPSAYPPAPGGYPVAPPPQNPPPPPGQMGSL